MSSMIETRTLRPERVSELEPVKPSVRFDWLMVLTMAWLIGGLNIDIWAHIHRPEDESFFSPWHGIMYSGFAANAAILYVTMLRNQLKGHYWMRAVPAGYELSIIGVILFIGGGFGDMVWHTAFGVENGVEALYSPTHLAIAVGGGMMLTGPVRSMWHRSDSEARNWLKWLPAALSLSFLITLFGFFTTAVHPIANPLSAADASFYAQRLMGAADDLHRAVSTIGVIVASAVAAAIVLVAVKRWKLLPGTLTLVFALHAFMMGFITVEDSYPLRIVASLAVSGLVIEALYYVLRPSLSRILAFRLFAGLAPLTWAAFYFAGVEASGGIPWSKELWGGVIVEAGIVGWLISYLVVPPKLPSRDEAQS